MCNCLLCRNKIADKTGSHIIPNFLIESSFADGKYKGRGRELVYNVNVISDFSFGRDILPDKVEKAIGRSLTDEDIEKNTNNPIPYVRDYVFCTDCEKRLGTIESLYADSISGCNDINGVYTNNVAPHISHLFWLSVMWRISAVDFEFRFTDKSGVEEDMRQILDGLLHKDPNEIPSEGELIERLKSYAYVLVRFPDNKGISGGYFAPVKEMVKDYTPFFINNYLLLISPIRNASVTGSFCYGIENIDRDEYANRAVNNEKIVCLDKDKFMLALKNHAELHAKRLESEIGIILSSYIEEPCPTEFVHDIFLEYIRPIAELHGKVESGAIILNSMNKERLYKICFDTLQQWRVIPEKMSKLPPVIFEKFRDDNGYGEDTK